VYENAVLKRIFWPKRDEQSEGWRRLHNEELYDLYSSSNIIQVMKSVIRCHVARMGKRCIEGFGGEN
jgi:hypothetical protein